MSREILESAREKLKVAITLGLTSYHPEQRS